MHLYDYIESTQITQDNIPHLKILNLVVICRLHFAMKGAMPINIFTSSEEEDVDISPANQFYLFKFITIKFPITSYYYLFLYSLLNPFQSDFCPDTLLNLFCQSHQWPPGSQIQGECFSPNLTQIYYQLWYSCFLPLSWGDFFLGCPDLFSSYILFPDDFIQFHGYKYCLHTGNSQIICLVRTAHPNSRLA